jgi:predicted DNA-binding protein (MmcQ/YjbR family)
MDIQQLYEFCLSKKGVTEHFPFDEDTLVFKVGGKMFCLTSLKEWEKGDHSINLKCDPDKAIGLRAQYEAVNPGYHMSKNHWNTVDVNKDLPLKDVVKLIEHSYDLVYKSLTKKLQAEIEKEAD